MQNSKLQFKSQNFSPEDLKKLYIPASDSHKGQNGKLMIIGGSKLFHAASLWSLKIASRIVDMTFYSSIPENNEIVAQAKKEFRDGIVVPRNRIEDYISETDCVLIGPGLTRKSGEEEGDDDTKELTERLLQKYPEKKWVIDGGSLQTINPEIIPENAIITPHQGEFKTLVKNVILSEREESRSFADAQDDKISNAQDDKLEEQVSEFAKEHNCVILLKGEKDIVASPNELVEISGGNAGMTKGGTGDVLAGLVAALYCKNDAFLAAKCASYINKKAGESLAKKVGLYFNSSDLVDEIPKVMKELIL